MSDRFLVPFIGDFDDWWYPARRQHRHRRQLDPWNQLERELESAVCRAFPASELEFFSPSVESHVDGSAAGAVTPKGEDGKYTLNVPLGGNIGPEDLKVSLKDEEGLKMMTIQAKKEHKSNDGNQRYYYEMSRKFSLPPNVDPAQVKSVLTPDGFLKVEAPLPPPPAQQQIENKEPAKPKEIPISRK